MSPLAEQAAIAGDGTHLTLKAFERALLAAVASAEIDLRPDEDEDGTRTVHAWQRSNPGAVSVFAIDDVRIGSDQVDRIAQAICTSFPS